MSYCFMQVVFSLWFMGSILIYLLVLYICYGFIIIVNDFYLYVGLIISVVLTF